MTLRDHECTPEVLVIVGSRDDAAVLAALGTLGGEFRSTLVATGPDPMLVDEVLDELGTPAGRILLPEADEPEDAGPARELASLLPRLDDLVGEAEPAAVVVRGGAPTALAAAQAAVWRGVPLIVLPAPDESRTAAATRAMISELASWQTSTAGGTPFPARLELLVHERITQAAGRHVVGVGAVRPGVGPVGGLSA